MPHNTEQAHTMKPVIVSVLAVVVFSALCVDREFASLANGQTSALAERVQKLRKKQTVPAEDQGVVPPTSEAYQRMLKSVALVQIVTDEGTHSGTAWLVDAENKVFVTNQHVIEGFADCFVYFPEFIDGRLLTDPAASVRDDRANYAKVIDSAVGFDLALIQLEGELPESCIPLEIAEQQAAPGENIHSLAGSTVGSQSLWVYSAGHVRQIVRGTMANEYEASLLESDMATNQGNSGGPVCNDKGEVVAVVEGHRTDARLVSIYISQESLLEYLADALRCVNPTTVDDLQFAAQRNIDEGRYDYALDLANEAIELAPDNAALYCLRGWCWYYLDDQDSSIGDFDEAIELDRRHAQAYYGKGLWARWEGEYEKAIELISTAIRYAPTDARLFLSRGEVYGDDLEDWRRALQDFEMALKRSAGYSDAIKWRGYARIELGSMEEGLSDLEAVVQQYTGDPLVFFYYGAACEAMGNLEEALKFYSHSRELDPNDVRNLQRLAGTLIQMTQFAEASEPLQVALQIDPEDDLSNFLMGVSLAGGGDNTNAATFLGRAVELDPENPMYADAYRRATEGEDSEIQTYVSAPRVADEYVGRWSSSLSAGGSKSDFELNFGADGRYSLRIMRFQGNKQAEEIRVAGSFRIQKGMLICNNDGATEEETLPISWRGDQLLVYIKEGSMWLPFDKQE